MYPPPTPAPLPGAWWWWCVFMYGWTCAGEGEAPLAQWGRAWLLLLQRAGLDYALGADLTAPQMRKKETT